MEQVEPITEFLKRRLREAGPGRFEGIADEAGVTVSFVRKFVYGSRENPRVGTIQPLLDYFAAVDRGERELPRASQMQPEAAVWDGVERRKAQIGRPGVE